MNKPGKYFKRGLLVFILITVCMLASLYASHTGIIVLLFSCVICSIIASLGFVFIIMQSNKDLEILQDEVKILREREDSRVHKNQKTTEDNAQKTEVFKIDESLARIMPTADMQFKNVEEYCEKILQNIAKELNIVQGLIFVLNDPDEMFHISGQYAFYSVEKPRPFPLGENLSGQVAKYKELLNLKELPDKYVTVLSGLGQSTPHNLVIAPIINDNLSIGVMEIASFKPFGKNEELLISNICELMANRLNELRNIA